jgi:hypothetical protein
MEPKGLLPYSQKLATGHDSHPEDPSPYPHMLFL